ncbi:MAG: hypothetical protein QNJ41_10035 [Xenococcaceae cyanobacterium MO_188.B32]|nr:hypothetical protein [Xenococcaceae cyanobacterium MO_188.B32]
MTKVKIFSHCSTINFSKDYFRQQYQYRALPHNFFGGLTTL